MRKEEKGAWHYLEEVLGFLNLKAGLINTLYIRHRTAQQLAISA